jgi:osmotically inducible protein OsmC
MALSFALGNAGHPPEELNVTASVDLERVGEAFAITSIALEVGARIAGIDPAKFQTIAESAKRECPLSKALAATPITLSAKLN